MKGFSIGLTQVLLTALIVACGHTPEPSPTAVISERSAGMTASIASTATVVRPTRTAVGLQTPLPAATETDATAPATSGPGANGTPLSSETPTATATPVPGTTRMPSPAGPCPAPGDELPPIVPITTGMGIIEGFEPQMRAYLDAGGSVDGLQAVLGGLSLTDADGTIWQAQAQVVAVDVTGNATSDVVVALSFLGEGSFAEGGLFVFRCRDGRYEGGAVTSVGGQVFPGGGPGPGVRVIQDMNANDVQDIVFSYVEIVGTHTNFTRLFRIVEWDGSGFVDLIQGDAYPQNAAPVLNGDGVVHDSDGDGTLELLLTNGIGRGYQDGGPQRERGDVWAWNGHVFVLLRSEYEAPTYRFQAIQDGDDAARAGEYAQALASYQRAISDDGLLGWSRGQLWPDSAYGTAPTPTPDPGERSRLTAYATYRMMMVYVLQDALAEAQAVYETLEGLPADAAGRPYADLAVAFWEEYSAGGDVTSACARVVEHAGTQPGDILIPLGSGFYGYHNRDYVAEEICPFQ